MEIKFDKDNISDGVHFLKKKKYIVYKKGNELKICRNECKHQGNKFIKTKNPKKAVNKTILGPSFLQRIGSHVKKLATKSELIKNKLIIAM